MSKHTHVTIDAYYALLAQVPEGLTTAELARRLRPRSYKAVQSDLRMFPRVGGLRGDSQKRWHRLVPTQGAPVQEAAS